MRSFAIGLFLILHGLAHAVGRSGDLFGLILAGIVGLKLSSPV